MSDSSSARDGAVLSVRGLTKRFGKVTALREVGFDVPEGQLMCLLGPSGAGKTTTLKCVAGLERPDAGEILINGRDMSRIEPYDRGVAMAFENYALYPQQSVFANLASPLRSRRHRVPEPALRERVTRIAELLGIAALLDRLPGELSGGQRQRVALGRVLVRPAEVYLLDEPLSHLDAKLRSAMRAELKALRAAETLGRSTTVYVTHDYLEALALGDRIAVLREGGIVQEGTREEVWASPVDTFVARAFGRPEINLIGGAIVDLHGGRAFRSRDGAVELPLPDPVGPGSAPGGAAGTAPAAGTEVIIGVRPRDITLAGAPGPAGGAAGADHGEVAGRVYVVEPLGRQYELTVAAGETHLSMVGERADVRDLPADAPVRLRVPRAKLLLFDADGRLLTPAARERATVPEGGAR